MNTPITHEALIAAGWVEDYVHPRQFYNLGRWGGPEKRLTFDFEDGQVAEAGYLSDDDRPKFYATTMETLAAAVAKICGRTTLTPITEETLVAAGWSRTSGAFEWLMGNLRYNVKGVSKGDHRFPVRYQETLDALVKETLE